MTKALRKAIMTRSRLKSVHLENQNITDRNNCKYQRSVCTNLLRKTKLDYFRNLNPKNLNDNRKYLKKQTNFFLDNVLPNSKITLKEKD